MKHETGASVGQDGILSYSVDRLKESMVTRLPVMNRTKPLPNLSAIFHSLLWAKVMRQATGLTFLAWTAVVLGKYMRDVAADPPPSAVAAVAPYLLLWLLMILATVGVAGSVTLFVHARGRPVTVWQRYARGALGLAGLIAIVLGLRYHPGESALESLLDLAADDSMLLSGGFLLLSLSLSTFFLVRRLLGVQPPEVSVQMVVAMVGAFFLIITVLAQAVLPVLALLWICLVGWLIGDTLLRRIFRLGHLSSLERTLLALGLGLGVLAQALFFLGIAGFLYQWPILGGLSAVTILHWRRIVQIWQGLRVAWRDLDRRFHLDGVIAIVGGLTLMIALVNFIAALAPEFQSDATGMHLALPKLWIQTHQLQTLDRIHRAYWTMHNLHMLYTLGMLVHSATVAKLLHYSFGLLAMALIYALGRRVGDARVGVLGAIVFYSASTATVWWESGTAFVDLAYTFYTLAAILGLMVWLDTGQRRLLVLTGMMGGLGAGVKVLGGLVFVPAIMVIAVHHLRRRGLRLRALMADEVVLAGVGFLSNLTWLTFAQLKGGPNQFVPAVLSLLRLSTLADQVPIDPSLQRFGIGTDLTALLRLPWLLTFRPGLFGDIDHFGPTLLVLGAALILRPQLRSRNGYLLIICLVLSYLWAVTRQNARYALPIIALWSVLCMAAFVRLLDGMPGTASTQVSQWSFVATVVAGAVLGFQAWHYAGQSSPGFPYLVVFDLETESTYLSRRYPLYDSITFLNQSAGDEARVLAPFNRDNYYPEFVLESWAHATLGPYIGKLFQLRSPTDLRQMLREKGYTHLIMDQAAALRTAPLSEGRRGTLLDVDWLNQVLPLEFAAHGMYVYRVPDPGEPIMTSVTSSNGLNDGGFELGTGQSAWHSEGGPQIDRTGMVAHTGIAAALVDHENRLLQRVAVQAGHMYQLSLYARQADLDAQGRLLVEWVDDAGRPIWDTNIPFVAEQAYTRYSLTEVAPAGAAYAVVYVAGLEGRVWVDDVGFVERKSTSSTSLQDSEQGASGANGWAGSHSTQASSIGISSTFNVYITNL